MSVRTLILLAVAVAPVLLTGCLRDLMQNKDSLRSSKERLTAPTPPLPTTPVERAAPPNRVLPPASGSVKPPKFDLPAGSIPPMPGLPGSASQPLDRNRPNRYPDSIPDAPVSNLDPTAADGDDEKRKGLLPRVVDRIKENREKAKELPKLPPALEPKDEKKATPPPPVVPDKPRAESPKAAEGGIAAVRTLVDAAAKKFAATPDFEAKLTKREYLGGKVQPTEELRLLFRQEPFSVRLTVTGEHGRGREVLYVKGQNDGKLVIITGEGDNRLIGAGKKLEVDPSSPIATSRSRGRIEDSGLGRPIRILGGYVSEIEKGKRSADGVKWLGRVERKELKTPLDGVEVKLLPGDDPLMPKGGTRLYFFDADPQSAAYQLPVLILTYDPNDKEVEYYLFENFRLPAKLADTDFSVDQLGKKR